MKMWDTEKEATPWGNLGLKPLWHWLHCSQSASASLAPENELSAGQDFKDFHQWGKLLVWFPSWISRSSVKEILTKKENRGFFLNLINVVEI